jgi:hypothetical protein
VRMPFIQHFRPRHPMYWKQPFPNYPAIHDRLTFFSFFIPS